jgi:hypothetical protein
MRTAAQAATWEKSTVRNDVRGGRRLARAGVKTKEKRFRKGCKFITDAAAYSVRLTDGEFDQIERRARVLDQATCPRGCHNGVLGQCALQVLETFRKVFYNRRDGLCCPAVKQLQSAMRKLGYKWARSSIFEAFRRLELAGILKRTQRCKRQWVTISGVLRQTTVQMSSLYSFALPHAAAHLLPRPRAVQTQVERVGKFLNNLGRRMSVGAESTHRTGPEGTLLFPLFASCGG